VSEAYDVFGVRLEVGQRVLYATSWRQYAALHVGTLVALMPSPVVQPDNDVRPLARPAHALAVVTDWNWVRGAEAEAWLRRRLDEIEEG
jgi:hypothetical protein